MPVKGGLGVRFKVWWMRQKNNRSISESIWVQDYVVKNPFGVAGNPNVHDFIVPGTHVTVWGILEQGAWVNDENKALPNNRIVLTNFMLNAHNPLANALADPTMLKYLADAEMLAKFKVYAENQNNNSGDSDP